MDMIMTEAWDKLWDEERDGCWGVPGISTTCHTDWGGNGREKLGLSFRALTF